MRHRSPACVRGALWLQTNPAARLLPLGSAFTRNPSDWLRGPAAERSAVSRLHHHARRAIFCRQFLRLILEIANMPIMDAMTIMAHSESVGTG